MLTWTLVGILVAWAVIRGFGLERGYPMVPLIGFTPYVLAAGAIMTFLLVWRGRLHQAAVAGTAALALLIMVAPRAIGGPEDPGNAPTIRVLTANVLGGEADPVQIVEMVDVLDIDVLAIQELTPNFHSALIRAGISELLPNPVLQHRSGVAGGGLYSAFPLSAQDDLADEFDPLAFRMPRAVLQVPGAGPVNVLSVHPNPPLSWGVKRWEQELASLPATGGDDYWLLAGDFKATLDHDAFRKVLGRGYADAGAQTGNGLKPTWPADRAARPGITIDHVVYDRRLKVIDYRVLDLEGSDHRAVMAEVSLPPQ